MPLQRRLATAVLAAATCGLVLASPASAAPPPIKHVFVIVLENKNYDTTFGKSPQSPYLGKTLVAKGELLTKYYGIGHASLDNYIAMVSGQAPNPQTQADCQFFTEFVPGTMGADGQAMGSGCVYPASVKTVADQLTAKGMTWGGYMEDMGTPCRHPDIGSRDTTQSATAESQYAARHNPFVYFHSIIDKPDCALHDVDLSRLPAALESNDVPNFVFITPDLCSDGHDGTCADPKQKGGYEGIDGFLQTWVPKIMGSRAYRDGGLLFVTFDESGSGAESCCVDDAPNTPNAGGTSSGPGGGLIGGVLLSRYIKPGSVNATPYNHYSWLRSIEDLFGLQPLGYAGKSKGFGDDVYNGPRCFDTPLPAGTGRLARGTLVRTVTRTGHVLKITLARTARLTVTGLVSNGPRYTAKRHGRACHTVRLRVRGGTLAMKITATRGGRSERRTYKIH